MHVGTSHALFEFAATTFPTSSASFLAFRSTNQGKVSSNAVLLVLFTSAAALCGSLERVHCHTRGGARHRCRGTAVTRLDKSVVTRSDGAT